MFAHNYLDATYMQKNSISFDEFLATGEQRISNETNKQVAKCNQGKERKLFFLKM